MSDGRTERNEPWWLQRGVEECEICLRSVQYQALHHCSECDRGVCLTCSVTVVEQRILLCSECAQAGER